MDRHLMAYLILAVCVFALGLGLALARYYSRGQVLRRRRLADEARWTAQARGRGEDRRPAD